ncbi:hypothetical protein LSM04_002928 [Trypanosoma melophagium]|uniref:uncharacterized protein n=1 Tax=Trypanosoma melophagium TaxID=715481 RepID=UPI00351A57B3|nr:hypothetical protein LSM04_002928 [Trypanosoma melophagium]
MVAAMAPVSCENSKIQTAGSIPGAKGCNTIGATRKPHKTGRNPRPRAPKLAGPSLLESLGIADAAVCFGTGDWRREGAIRAKSPTTHARPQKKKKHSGSRLETRAGPTGCHWISQSPGGGFAMGLR